MTIPLDVAGSVRAEIFTLAMPAQDLVLTGPCGAAPWHVEIHDGEHPLASVRRIVADALDDVWLVHSTSWRWDPGTVTLTFIVVVGSAALGSMPAVPVGRVELARSSATDVPPSIAYTQVLEHGLRHLAWLAKEDTAVAETLPASWHARLAAYVPEPFQQLDGGPA